MSIHKPDNSDLRRVFAVISFVTSSAVLPARLSHVPERNTPHHHRRNHAMRGSTLYAIQKGNRVITRVVVSR